MNDEMNLSDILDCVKSGGAVPYDNLRFALLAMESLYIFLEMDVKRMLTHPNFYTPEYVVGEEFRRSKAAMQKSPKEWVGWNNNPDNPEYRARRGTSLKVVGKILQKDDKP